MILIDGPPRTYKEDAGGRAPRGLGCSPQRPGRPLHRPGRTRASRLQRYARPPRAPCAPPRRRRGPGRGRRPAPRPRTARTSSRARKSWSWWPMSRWAAGSSSSKTRGSWARPRARVASWRSPAESVARRRLARCSMPGLAQGAGDGLLVARGEPAEGPTMRIAAEGDAVAHREVSGPSSRRRRGREPCATASLGHSESGRPWNRTWPDAGARSPARVRTRVDLPAAFGPTTARASPARSSRLTSSSTAGRPRSTRRFRAPRARPPGPPRSRSSPPLVGTQGHEKVRRTQ